LGRASTPKQVGIQRYAFPMSFFMGWLSYLPQNAEAFSVTYISLDAPTIMQDSKSIIVTLFMLEY
jgi:hypothetical protein